MRIDRRDLPWLLMLLASLALGLAASWLRWGSPLVDCGREMNQPLRLLGGERLYADVAHIYGPLAPQLNGWLYGLFGPRLATLYGHGLVATLLILGLTYVLARQLMGRAAAALATFGVTWLCALKPSGNYVLPYAYAALDACALALGAVVVAAWYLRTRRTPLLALASVVAGLACLAKTEMGLAALVALGAAAVVGTAASGERWRALAAGVLPGLLLVAAVYGVIVAQVGFASLMSEGHVIPLRLPEPLLYYNRRMFGLDEPIKSLAQMLALGARLGLFAAALVWLALTRARHGESERDAQRRRAARRRSSWVVLIAIAAVVVSGPAASWDKGPFLAAPLLLLATLLFGVARLRRRAGRRRCSRHEILVVCSAFALAMLARTLLRVRSGGAYSSYLLPAAVILFVLAWTQLLPLLAPGGAARRATRRLALALLYLWMGSTAAVTVYRWQRHFGYELQTRRGTMRVLPDQGLAVAQAMAFVERRTRPDDAIVVMPEGTALQFFTGRRNPLPEEITTPGLLDEARAIRRITAQRVPLVLVTNRPTVEFGAAVLGRDYHQELMRVVRARYEVCGLFGRDVAPEAEIGDARFFIRAYCLRKTGAAGKAGRAGEAGGTR